MQLEQALIVVVKASKERDFNREGDVKILVVDDEANARKILTRILTRYDYEAWSCCCGEEAFSLWNQQHPAIVISDRKMPHCTGPELCKRIRSTPFVHYTYFILVTALGDREHYLEAMEAGADDFLTKPFDSEIVISRIRVAERILSLRQEVVELRGMLNTCCYCKSILDEHKEWTPMEQFFSRRAGSNFSHGICPACYEKHIQPRLEAAKDGDISL